jgi:hypothetical protein
MAENWVDNAHGSATPLEAMEEGIGTSIGYVIHCMARKYGCLTYPFVS